MGPRAVTTKKRKCVHFSPKRHFVLGENQVRVKVGGMMTARGEHKFHEE